MECVSVKEAIEQRAMANLVDERLSARRASDYVFQELRDFGHDIDPVHLLSNRPNNLRLDILAISHLPLPGISDLFRLGQVAVRIVFSLRMCCGAAGVGDKDLAIDGNASDIDLDAVVALRSGEFHADGRVGR